MDADGPIADESKQYWMRRRSISCGLYLNGMLFLEVGAGALGGASDGLVQENALAGQGSRDTAHVLGATANKADAAGADQAAGVGRERLVLGD